MTDLPPREAIERGADTAPETSDGLPPRESLDREGLAPVSAAVPGRGRFAAALDRMENSARYGVVALVLGVGALTAREFWPSPAPASAGAVREIASTPQTVDTALPDALGPRPIAASPVAPAPAAASPREVEPESPPAAVASLDLAPPEPPAPVVIAPAETPVEDEILPAFPPPARVIPATRIRPAQARRPATRRRPAQPKSLLSAFFAEVGSIPHHARRNAARSR